MRQNDRREMKFGTELLARGKPVWSGWSKLFLVGAVLAAGAFSDGTRSPLRAAFPYERFDDAVLSIPSKAGPAQEWDGVEVGLREIFLKKTSVSNHWSLASATGKRLHAAVAEFYLERDYRPVWTIDGKLSAKARAVLGKLKVSDDDGLDPRAYALPDELVSHVGRKSLREAATLEILISQAVLAYAQDAQGGRVNGNRLSGYIDVKPSRPDPIQALHKVAQARRPAEALDSFNPPHEGFQKLRDKLIEMRADKILKRFDEEAPQPIPVGETLREGDQGPRVVLLRRRLNAPTAPDGAADVFDASLKEAVIAFQKSSSLTADGIAGARTILALNGATSEGAEADIVANLERWRWLPRDLGAFHVMVNVPEFLARIYNDGEVVYETKVVVGTARNQTPVFSEDMNHVIVNPYWNVPYSITSKEMLPGIRANPVNYLTNRGYEVVRNGRVVDPLSVDWAGVNLRSVRIRQKPGGRNALGNIKFMFPNRHAVYMHDTPSKSLFGRVTRAFSHGCVRVEDPFAFADAVLRQEEGWNGARLKKAIGGKERRINLKHKVPVHIVYFTSFVDDEGRLQRRPDIYGQNGKLEAALGL